jgi:hypothetical protein
MKPTKSTPPNKSSAGDDRYEHDAFGLVRINRIEGGSQTLFQSDLKHDRSIELTISTATLDRGLHSDWVHAKSEIVQVRMSQAQWATLVSSMNMGSGVPCTIQHIQHKRMPVIDATPKRETFESEIKQFTSKIISKAAQLEKILEEMLKQSSIKKGDMKNLQGGLRNIIQDLHSNLPFIEKCFHEEMETTTEAAKAEVENYLLTTVINRGLEAIRNPLQLEHKDDES